MTLVSEGQRASGLSPDLEEARRFLAALDPDAAQFTFQTFDDVKVNGKPRADRSLAHTFQGTLGELTARLVALNSRGAGVFVTVNQTDLKGRSTENVVRARAVWQDDDAGHGWTAPLAPSLVVNTSPGKHQRYLLADGLTLEESAAALETMVAKHGCDNGAKGVNRVLRLPGFYHMKDHGKPFLVQLMDGDGRRYSRSEILAALPSAPRAERRRTTAELRSSLKLMDDSEVTKAKSAADHLNTATNGDEFGERATWLEWGQALHHETGGNEQGYALWCELSARHCPTKYDADDQRRTWESFKANCKKPVTLGTIYKRAKKDGWQPPAVDPDTFDREIGRLAQLRKGAYFAERTAAATRLRVPANRLDALVNEQRNELEAKERGSHIFVEDEPWPDEIDGATLLDELVAHIRRHAVLPDYASETVALWCALAHAHDAAFISPILALQSPEKRCGKTTALLVIKLLVPKPVSGSSATPAILFRLIDAHSPTLLLDEADTFITDENSELRGVLNSGHNRGEATAWRCVGDDHEAKPFRTWCPKVAAGIGHLPDTLQDRSVRIPMKRKMGSEKIEPLRQHKVEAFSDLRRKAARWAADNLERLKEHEPNIPDGLNDRAADNWRTMLAIADVAGGDWPRKAREAAMALSKDNEALIETWKPELLRDIRRVYDRQVVMSAGKPASAISSSTLVDALVGTHTALGLQDTRWRQWGREAKPITARFLASALKPFNIRPDHTQKGSVYNWSDFEDAWKRYASEAPTRADPPGEVSFCQPEGEYPSSSISYGENEKCQPSVMLTDQVSAAPAPAPVASAPITNSKRRTWTPPADGPGGGSKLFIGRPGSRPRPAQPLPQVVNRYGDGPPCP